jgi:thiamine transport system ATP-binding protein
MIEVEEVRFAYEEATMCFSLRVARGECMAVIGPSGGGKSTLLSLIAGFEAPTSGRILIDGEDMGGHRPDQRPTTTLFQEHNLFSHLTVEQNIGLGLHPGLKLTADHRGEIDEALERVGLAGLHKRFPAELSGGQRQRVALARTLVRRKPILLLDEPFSALDPPLRRAMLDLVDDIRRDRALTIVMVSHDPNDAARIAGRTAFIEAGRVVGVYGTDALAGAAPPPELAGYLGRRGERE